MHWENWILRWEATLEAVSRMGGEVEKLKIGPKASEADVQLVESELGFRLPPSFRKVLLEFAASVSFAWSLPPEITLPKKLKGIISGECCWDLSRLTEIDTSQKRLNETFEDTKPDDEEERDDPYAWTMDNKFAFVSVPNGDFIAFDLFQAADSPVVYLSHEGYEGHGYRLGNNFIDFIDRWTMIGCPGSEGWRIIPFLPSSTSGIDSMGATAVQWRNWLNQHAHKQSTGSVPNEF